MAALVSAALMGVGEIGFTADYLLVVVRLALYRIC